jgi:hypothetical protein
MPRERIKCGDLRPGDLIHQRAGYVLILDVSDEPAHAGCLYVMWLEFVTIDCIVSLHRHELTARRDAVFSWTGSFTARCT